MALRRRDPAGELRRVYRRNVESVYAFFAYSVGREDAEDLTSATFERVLRAWSSYDRRRSGERTWILAIARNLLVDFYRRRSHRRGPSLDEHPGLLERPGPAEPDESPAIGAMALRDWLAPLSERDREVLALRYGADLSAKEIAALLELSPANVHQILSRSLRRLRELAEAEQLSGSA